ncbi:MAG: hypothetical protein RBG1_1C00001G1148 [candidate division Zixibacteria bacterium RBG-1]|nr:MAG: hypothetical protein RBG1_1C00001G1148 [candidate division Zixibacteria bacterium RBG-1]
MYRRRNSLRLKEFDYKKEGPYFVTISCREKESFFENKPLKQILVTNIEKLENRFSITVNAYVVMPNHVHLIVTLPENDSFSLSKIIQVFKSLVTYDARLRGNKKRIWQRGFYEHVIRNEKDFLEKMKYILNNPLALEIKKRADIKSALTRR